MLNEIENISTHSTLQSFLNKRQQDLSIRTLQQKNHLVDFCSNDYLGFASSALLKHKTAEIIRQYPFQNSGATGSRLISGNNAFAEELENILAKFHNTEAALLFNSGYDANLGFFSSVPQKHDLIIFDELVHASIRDGIKMSRANAISFSHNNLEDLAHQIQAQQYEQLYVVVESIYSMDGDEAPLQALVALCKKQQAHLIVDEAHATGIYGKNGEGLVQQLNIESEVFARIHTFGKALGCHGAVVVGSNILKQFLVNYARSFIYTTALPFHSLASISAAYKLLPFQNIKRQKLNTLIQLFKEKTTGKLPLLESNSPIQSIILSGNKKTKNISLKLENEGFYAKAILHPTVAKGSERIRICLHSFNTNQEVTKLADILIKNI